MKVIKKIESVGVSEIEMILESISFEKVVVIKMKVFEKVKVDMRVNIFKRVKGFLESVSDWKETHFMKLFEKVKVFENVFEKVKESKNEKIWESTLHAWLTGPLH